MLYIVEFFYTLLLKDKIVYVHKGTILIMQLSKSRMLHYEDAYATPDIIYEHIRATHYNAYNLPTINFFKFDIIVLGMRKSGKDRGGEGKRKREK